MSKKDEGGWPPQQDADQNPANENEKTPENNGVPCDAPAFRAVEEHAGEMKLSAPVFAAVKQAKGWAAGKKVEKAVFEEAVNGVLAFVDPASVEEKIGDGPLRDLIVSSLSIAKTTVYAIALEGTVPGTVSGVSAGSENAGTGTVAVSGNPRNEYDVRVDITSSGTLNDAAFRVTIDGSGGLKSGKNYHRS